jgi:hypothetical protein
VDSTSNWAQRSPKLVKLIVSQVDPPPFQPLTNQAIRHFLTHFKLAHVAVVTALGIAAAVDSEVEQSRRLLEQAAATYERMDVQWAQENENRLRRWLASPSEELLTILRYEAAAGAALLGVH